MARGVKGTLMKCDNCDRENAVRAYCYYSQNPTSFKVLTGNDLSPETFAEYVIEMQLTWTSRVSCISKHRDEMVSYWKILEPHILALYKQ